MWTIPNNLERKYKDYNYAELIALIRSNEFKDLDNMSKADIYVQYSLLLYRERDDSNYSGLAKEQPFFLFSKLKGLDRVFREYLNDVEKECYQGAIKYFNEKDANKLNEFKNEFLKFQAHICLFFIVNYASNHDKNAQTFLTDLLDSAHLKTLHALDEHSVIREHFIRAYVSAIFAKLLYLIEASNISKLYYESSIYFSGSFTGTLEMVGIKPVVSKHSNPYQTVTKNRKEIAFPLADKIWKFDKDNILLIPRVAKIILQLMPNKALSQSQIEGWLRDYEGVPKQIREINNKNQTGKFNAKNVKVKIDKLETEILKKLSKVM